MKLSTKIISSVSLILTVCIGLSSIYFIRTEKELLLKNAYHRAEVIEKGTVVSMVTFMQLGIADAEFTHNLIKGIQLAEEEEEEVLELRLIHSPDIAKTFISEEIAEKYRPTEEELPRDEMERNALAGVAFKKEAVVKIKGKDYRTIRFITPINAKKQCLSCHYFQEGETTAAFSTVISLEPAYRVIRERTIQAALLIGIVLILTAAILYFSFHKIAIISIEREKKIATATATAKAKAEKEKAEALAILNGELESSNKELREVYKEEQEARHLLEASEKKYRLLFESSYVGQLVMDAETGVVSNANGFLLDLINYSRDEAMGKKFWEIGVPRELISLAHPVEKTLPVGQISHKDILLKTSDGRDIVVEISYVAFKSDGKNFIQCAFHNVTGRKWMEEQVGMLNAQLQARAAELDAANRALQKVGELKDGFVGTVSHELRTPLAMIKEGVSVVLDGVAGELNAKQKKMLGIAFNNIDRLGHIVNNILDISKIESGKMEIQRGLINFTSVVFEVAEAFEPVARQKGLELKRNFSREKEIKIFADKDGIAQVLNNLISNAMKFTANGHIEISIDEDGDSVICAVSDTGRGFSKEEMSKVFNKFQQFGRISGPGEKGTGLGLSICKGIVEMHNGKIWVESEPDKGSRFIFRLPKHNPA